MKILNLYACLGGNRYKWNEVKNDIEVTAVELDPECARLYQERFPNDNVIVADAHQYLLDHYKEFDFIWSSPPCPSHSVTNNFLNAQGVVRFPDMKLYEEIILLKHFYKGKYCIENVISYYEPLIIPHKRGRHYYWTNFNLPNILSTRKAPSMEARGKGVDREDKVENWIKFHDYNFRNYKGKQAVNKMARNLVDYEAGKTIFETMLGIVKKQNIKQTELF
tara:strand:- start:225 stop:887 length:663 start_codon:yes stop_codon:yes gene_type:complete